ncbi:MAG: glycosyltransferase family 2 protein [Aureispira sp.]
MLIDVLIPTYNRGADVLANLKELEAQIATNNLWEVVQIVISDNCSPDDTAHLVQDYCAQKPTNLQVHYHRNKENIGLERNAVAVLEQASSPFVLFLGDDDFLAEGYLNYCYQSIQQYDDLGCIIPGILSIFQDGSSKDVRGSAPEAVKEAGFDALLAWSHWGHQMSGILCRREGLLSTYLEQPNYRNPYLFLYFTAYSLYKHRGIYNPQYKTRVNAFNEKDWGYNKVGLLDEVYKCYYYFQQQLSEEQITAVLLRFTTLHSYRLSFSTKNFKKIYQQYQQLITSTPSFQGFKPALRKMFLKDSLKALLK